MSYSSEVMIVHGCIIKGGLKTLAQKTKDEDTFDNLIEPWIDNEWLYIDYVGCDDDAVFGYQVSATYDPNYETFTAVPLNFMDINVAKEQRLEEAFHDAFGEYPPVFTTMLLIRTV